MKCGYSKCLHDGEVDKEESIKVGTKYYHKDCHKQMEDKKEIRQLYLENINPTEVVKNLNSAINSIIHDKHVDSDFFLYAVKYAIRHKLNINSPYGLHYIINNKKIMAEYRDVLVKQKMKDLKLSNSEIKADETTFSFNSDSEKTLWEKITKQ